MRASNDCPRFVAATVDLATAVFVEDFLQMAAQSRVARHAEEPMSMLFARYVQDKRRSRPLLLWSLAVAAFVECSALCYFLLSSLWHVDEVNPPPLYVLLLQAAAAPPPPPLLPRPPITSSSARPLKRRAPGTRLLQPRPNAAQAPTREAPTSVEPDVPGDDPEPPGIPSNDPPGNSPAPPLPPDPPKQPIKKVPFFLIKKQQLRGDDPHLPPSVKQQRRGQTIAGTYLVCIDKSGHVSDVSTLLSIPGADEEIAKTLRTWLYKEQPIPVCFTQHFEFIIE